MGAPNPDDPLANDVAEHWKTDEKGAIEEGIYTIIITSILIIVLIFFFISC